MTTYGCGPVAAANDPVSLSGWLHIVWNGEPRVMLIDDRGAATRLLVDEAVLRTYGGMRGLNRRRVTITGERVNSMPEAVRVLSIQPEADGK